MGVPSDQLMQMIKSQRDSATPTGVPQAPEVPTGMSENSAAPMGSPMSTPEPKMGNKEAAMINLSMAQDLLEQALPAVGSDSEEGRSILNAIGVINKVIGPKNPRPTNCNLLRLCRCCKHYPKLAVQRLKAKQWHKHQQSQVCPLQYLLHLQVAVYQVAHLPQLHKCKELLWNSLNLVVHQCHADLLLSLIHI